MSQRHKDSGAISGRAHCASDFDSRVERWVAIRTSARWEKKLLHALTRENITAFLPMWTRVTRYRTRKNVTQVPLFSGYLFVDESCSDRISKLSPAIKRLIAQIIRPIDYDVLKAELQNIAAIVSDQQLVREKVFGSVGESVRITRGSFRNFEGKIARPSDAPNRLVLAISFLGLAVEVEVEDAALEKLV